VLSAVLLKPGMEPYPGCRLSRHLGSGGFGEVWEAKAADGRSVALKFLSCDARQTAAREIRSLQAIRQLRHPHLIRINQVWACQGYIVIAMERADGSLADLSEVYRSEFGTPVPAKDVCFLLSQAAAALDFLNTRRHRIHDRYVTVQHCDVKPSNLLLLGQTCKVCDFGLSVALGSELETRTRAGTLDYCAPEVFQGRLSSQTDQYALAVTYCLLRGGRLPFSDTPRSFQTHYIRPAPDLSMLSEAERPTVARALHPLPINRWPSCGAMMTRLSQVVHGAAYSESTSIRWCGPS
jgi:serine/threonine-protein kinase